MRRDARNAMWLPLREEPQRVRHPGLFNRVQQGYANSPGRKGLVSPLRKLQVEFLFNHFIYNRVHKIRSLLGRASKWKETNTVLKGHPLPSVYYFVSSSSRPTDPPVRTILTAFDSRSQKCTL